ncbi:hypothetical protein VP01_886g1 [Puccinia sorghi]|uniref:Uncharacterized protein n=1 Tax=Puccinia sorghi TaxID=27349 RepID=A0A0L6U8B0_9BASI|nr:hypothetical protein VP01_886g1 [Puccinia sorghi]
MERKKNCNQEVGFYIKAKCWAHCSAGGSRSCPICICPFTSSPLRNSLRGLGSAPKDIDTLTLSENIKYIILCHKENAGFLQIATLRGDGDLIESHPFRSVHRMPLKSNDLGIFWPSATVLRSASWVFYLNEFIVVVSVVYCAHSVVQFIHATKSWGSKERRGNVFKESSSRKSYQVLNFQFRMVISIPAAAHGRMRGNEKLKIGNLISLSWMYIFSLLECRSHIPSSLSHSTRFVHRFAFICSHRISHWSCLISWFKTKESFVLYQAGHLYWKNIKSGEVYQLDETSPHDSPAGLVERYIKPLPHSQDNVPLTPLNGVRSSWEERRLFIYFHSIPTLFFSLTTLVITFSLLWIALSAAASKTCEVFHIKHLTLFELCSTQVDYLHYPAFFLHSLQLILVSLHTSIYDRNKGPSRPTEFCGEFLSLLTRAAADRNSGDHSANSNSNIKKLERKMCVQNKLSKLFMTTCSKDLRNRFPLWLSLDTKHTAQVSGLLDTLFERLIAFYNHIRQKKKKKIPDNVLSHRRLISESRLEFLMEAATLTNKNLNVLNSNWEVNYANLLNLLKNSSLISQETLSSYTKQSIPILNNMSRFLSEQKESQPVRIEKETKCNCETLTSEIQNNEKLYLL